MCGRFVITSSADAIRTLFGTTNPPINFPASWNVAPSQPAMVIRRAPDTGMRHLDALNWGLVPHFVKDLKQAPRPINARSETAGTSGMFRSALNARRCLVAADAFYEWAREAGGKQPYAIARVDGKPMAMAALWESWRAPDGEIYRSFAILTCAANSLLSGLHDRMPVILDEPDWPVWLGETGGDFARLLAPADNRALKFWPVSTAVNNVKNNDPSLLRPLAPAPTAIAGATPSRGIPG